MANKRHLSFLRSARKQSGLTQKELAFLVGVKSHTQLSRFERMKRLPPIETLITIMIIFKKGPEELLPHLYDSLLKLVHLRARELHEELQGDDGHTTKAKLDALEAMLAPEVKISEPDNPPSL